MYTLKNIYLNFYNWTECLFLLIKYNFKNILNHLFISFIKIYDIMIFFNISYLYNDYFNILFISNESKLIFR